MTAPEIVIDHNRYPTEDSLDAFEKWLADADVWTTARWLVEDLPKVASVLAYPRCTVTDDRSHVRVEFATGGWSGAEDVIGVLLSNPMLRGAFYAEWKRGGLHVFDVPRAFLGAKP